MDEGVIAIMVLGIVVFALLAAALFQGEIEEMAQSMTERKK